MNQSTALGSQWKEGFPKRAAVLFDFEAEMEGELTVNIGKEHQTVVPDLNVCL